MLRGEVGHPIKCDDCGEVVYWSPVAEFTEFEVYCPECTRAREPLAKLKREAELKTAQQYLIDPSNFRRKPRN